MKLLVRNLTISAAIAGLGFALGFSGHSANEGNELGGQKGSKSSSASEASASQDARRTSQRSEGSDEAFASVFGSSGLLNLLAKQNPESLLAALSVLEEPISKWTLDALYDLDREEALEVVQSSVTGDTYAELLNIWGMKDPLFFYDWMKANQLKLESGAYDSLEVNTLWKLSELDPYRAHEFSSNLNDKSDQETILIEAAFALSGTDPEAGFAWLEKLSQDESVSQRVLSESYLSIVGGYSKANPKEAAQLVAGLNPSELQEKLAQTVAASFAKEDMESAVAWLDSLDTDASRAAGWNGIFEDTLNTDQAALIDQILNRKDLFATSSTGNFELLMNLADYAPEQLGERFLEVFPEDQQQRAADVFVSSLIRDDIQKAADWADDRIHGAALNEAATRLAEHYMYGNQEPRESIGWAARIEDPEQRTNLLHGLIHHANAKHLETISEVLETVDLTEGERVDLDRQIATRLDYEFTPLVLPTGRN